MNFREITPQEIQSSLINIRQITFEVTDACNLQCKYCGYGDLYFGYDKRESNYMTFTQAKSIIDYLANLWNSNKAASIQRTRFFLGIIQKTKRKEKKRKEKRREEKRS